MAGNIKAKKQSKQPEVLCLPQVHLANHNSGYSTESLLVYFPLLLPVS